MRRIQFALMASAVLGACAEEGSVLTIVNVPIPSSSCTISPTGTSFSSSGFYDPSGADSFFLPLIVRNNLIASENDPVVDDSGSEVRPGRNNVELLGFDVCWARGDSTNTGGFGAGDDGKIVDCDKLPSSQKSFAPTSATIGPGASAALSINVLPFSVLDAPGIFGDAFDLGQLVQDWFAAVSGGTALPDAEDPGRSAAWGNYPQSDTATIILSLRASAKLMSGGSVESQWFSFPVNVCALCLIGACGVVEAVVCEGGGAGFQGSTVSALNSCVPFSGGTIVCEDVDTCDQ